MASDQAHHGRGRSRREGLLAQRGDAEISAAVRWNEQGNMLSVWGNQMHQLFPDLAKGPSRRGEIAARKLGSNLHDRIPVTIALPGAAGEKVDYLDVLLRDGAEAVRIGIAAAEPFVPTIDELEDAV